MDSFGPVMERLSYNPDTFPFAKVIAYELGVRDLSRLHEDVLARLAQQGVVRPLDSRDNNAERDKLRLMSDDAYFYKVFYPFVVRVLRPLFIGPMSYTHQPTFRVHMPQTVSVSAMHRDAEVTGRSDQITAWMPFVDTADTNTIWVEQTYGGGDLAPVPVRHGEVILLDTSYLEHGSVSNLTEFTRVSVDFRISGQPGQHEPIIERILGKRPPNYRVERQSA